MRVGLLVPTLNPGPLWADWLAALAMQTLQPDRVLQIDSGSTDGSLVLSRQADVEIKCIQKADFDHGGTRQLGVDTLGDCDIVICLTQDAILADPASLARLVAVFRAAEVALAWGRQLPSPGANPFAMQARLFNYPSQSRTVSLADRQRLGLKTAFASNSFAAWRREALMQVGGFPVRSLFGEDMQACARLLLAGGQVAYVAEATAYHSHNYTLSQEFRRYVDIGAFHAAEPWLLKEFGAVEGEGLRQLKAELAALKSCGVPAQLSCILRAACKWMGYRIGRVASSLPLPVIQRISMHPHWWR